MFRFGEWRAFKVVAYLFVFFLYFGPQAGKMATELRDQGLLISSRTAHPGNRRGKGSFVVGMCSALLRQPSHCVHICTMVDTQAPR
jgi:hypothetical protein